MSGVYDHAIEILNWLDERGLSHDICLHSKHVPGCPACTQHLMDFHGLVPTRWNPELWAAFTAHYR